MTAEGTVKDGITEIICYEHSTCEIDRVMEQSGSETPPPISLENDTETHQIWINQKQIGTTLRIQHIVGDRKITLILTESLQAAVTE